MRLADYMTKHGMRDGAFAEIVGVGRTTVMRWRTGRVFPDPSALRSIFDATKGRVTANDFFHAAVAEAKAIKQ